MASEVDDQRPTTQPAFQAQYQDVPLSLEGLIDEVESMLDGFTLDLNQVDSFHHGKPEARICPSATAKLVISEPARSTYTPLISNSAQTRIPSADTSSFLDIDVSRVCPDTIAFGDDLQEEDITKAAALNNIRSYVKQGSRWFTRMLEACTYKGRHRHMNRCATGSRTKPKVCISKSEVWPLSRPISDGEKGGWTIHPNEDLQRHLKEVEVLPTDYFGLLLDKLARLRKAMFDEDQTPCRFKRLSFNTRIQACLSQLDASRGLDEMDIDLSFSIPEVLEIMFTLLTGIEGGDGISIKTHSIRQLVAEMTKAAEALAPSQDSALHCSRECHFFVSAFWTDVLDQMGDFYHVQRGRCSADPKLLARVNAKHCEFWEEALLVIEAVWEELARKQEVEEGFFFVSLARERFWYSTLMHFIAECSVLSVFAEN